MSRLELDIFTREESPGSHTPTHAWRKMATDWLYNFNSDNTRMSYRRAIEVFFQFVSKHPKHVTKSDILQYRHALDEAGYSQATINLRITALSSFYKEAVAQGLRESNPCTTIKRKSVSPYGKATYLEGEQDILLLEQIDRSTDKGKRDYTILLIFLTTAVRVGAVSKLRMSDFRIQGDQVFMSYRNKGGEIIERKLQQPVVEALIDYLDTRPALGDDAAVFVSSSQRTRGQNKSADKANRRERPLSTRSIQRMVKQYADAAFGEGHGITPHSLRHTAAMNAIYSGASVIEVSKLLRHKNMRVTTVYIQHVEDKADDNISQKLAQRYAGNQSG